MPDISDLLPEGFSISIPKRQNPSSKNASPEEIEEQLSKNVMQKEKELRNAIYNLASFYSQVGLQDKALKGLDYLMQFTSDAGEKAHYYYSMGCLMEQKNNFTMAVNYYQKAFSLEPTNNDTWYFIHNNLGYSLNKLERYSESERYCRIAIQIQPKRYNAYKNLAISLEGQGKYVDAVEYYIKSTKANSTDRRALLHLEDLLKRKSHLLKENPNLITELEECRKASKFAQELIQGLIEKYRE